LTEKEHEDDRREEKEEGLYCSNLGIHDENGRLLRIGRRLLRPTSAAEELRPQQAKESDKS